MRNSLNTFPQLSVGGSSSATEISNKSRSVGVHYYAENLGGKDNHVKNLYFGKVNGNGKMFVVRLGRYINERLP